MMSQQFFAKLSLFPDWRRSQKWREKKIFEPEKEFLPMVFVSTKPGTDAVKLFTVVIFPVFNYRIGSSDSIFSHVRPFYERALSNVDRSIQISLWVSVAHSSFIEGSHMTKIQPLALPTNNRLGWRGLPWTNTLAF